MPYNQFKNVFVSECGGDLIRKDTCEVVRKNYSYTFRDIKNTLQLRATLRNGKYTDVGGYPLFLVFGDSGVCCFDCAKRDYRMLSNAIVSGDKNGSIIGCDVNWEDDDMQCDVCNMLIPSAYEGNDDE